MAGREASSEHVHGPACEWARRTGEAECIDGYAYAPAGRETTCPYCAISAEMCPYHRPLPDEGREATAHHPLCDSRRDTESGPYLPCTCGAGRGTTLVCPRCMDNLVQHKGEIGYYCGRCDEAWTYIPGRHRWSDVSAPARETST